MELGGLFGPKWASSLRCGTSHFFGLSFAASTEIGKRAKAMWIKHGAQDVRLSQIFTGQFTGQYILVIVFADMAAYAKAVASTATELQQILAEQAKTGAALQERTILVGVDL